jgi:hypothetical protein
MKTKSSLNVIDRAIRVFQNPDDFLYGSFLAEEIENIGATTVYLLTGIEKRSKTRSKVLTYEVTNGTSSNDGS